MSDIVKVDRAAIRQLVGPGSEVAGVVHSYAEGIARRARANAPRRTGRLAAGIVVRKGIDSRGYYEDVVTTADRDGFEYAALQEFVQPYMRPAIR